MHLVFSSMAVITICTVLWLLHVICFMSLGQVYCIVCIEDLFSVSKWPSLGAATIVTLVILLILCSICVSLYHWILGLLLLKGRMWDL